MNVEVKLFAYFRENRFVSQQSDYSDNTTVMMILEQLGIPAEEVGVTMINGRHCTLDRQLQDGDSLGIFPMIGGG